jgi:hypothetical protein
LPDRVADVSFANVTLPFAVADTPSWRTTRRPVDDMSLRHNRFCAGGGPALLVIGISTPPPAPRRSSTPGSEMPMPPRATAAILTFLAIAAVPELVPPLNGYRIYDWRAASAGLDFVPRRQTLSPLEEERLRLRPEADARRSKS